MATERTNSLVDFQHAIFAQIAAFQERGDERLCLRANAGDLHWAMDSGDIHLVAQMPKSLPNIPAAPAHILGLVQHDSEVYTVFDFGAILTGKLTPRRNHNRVLVLHHDLLPGAALLVERTYSLIPMDDMLVSSTPVTHELADTMLATKTGLEGRQENWNWLNFEKLLSGPAFASRRAEVAQIAPHVSKDAQ